MCRCMSRFTFIILEQKEQANFAGPSTIGSFCNKWKNLSIFFFSKIKFLNMKNHPMELVHIFVKRKFHGIFQKSIIYKTAEYNKAYFTIFHFGEKYKSIS